MADFSEEKQSGERQEDVVRETPAGQVQLSIRCLGAGTPVVLVPGMGRSAADYEYLATVLVGVGYQATGVDPRGVARSSGPMEGLSLHDLAADVAAVVEHVGRPVHVVGHMVGQRVVRTLAVDRPDLVRSVTVLAAGGYTPVAPEVAVALLTVLDPAATDAQRLAALEAAFFAPGNDASLWLEGWWPEAAPAQAVAAASTPTEEWWTPPAEIPLLVVQGLEDRLAPPENGRFLAAGRAKTRLVEIENAGHALLPEQPGAVAAAVRDFVRDVDGGGYRL